jgi:hypothetical protein
LARSIDDLSDVAQTITALRRPSGPSSCSRNSRTSRPRSPISATTVTSTAAPFTSMPISVDLPPPAAAKMPMRWPSPQVSTASSARTPSSIGWWMMRRRSGSGASANTG